RARMRGARRDHLAGGDQEIDGQVVGEHGDALGGDLERMHRREDRCRLADLPLLAEQPILEIAVAAALAEARAIAADGDGAAHDQVDRAHLARRDGATPPAGAADARGERRPLAETLRIDLDEALLGAQPRYGHVEDLPLGEREAPDG